jgi:hypothetical protein
MVKLRWQGGGVIAGAGLTTTSKPFNCNGAYDVDPAVGGAVVNAFTEWMAIYGVYRVVTFDAKVNLANREAFPVRCASGFFPFVNSTFPNTEWGNVNSIEHRTMAPLTGNSVTKFRHKIDIDRLFGVNASIADLTNFYGTSATNPSTLGNFCIGIASMGAAELLANGVNYGVTFDLTLELSFPQALNATLSSPLKPLLTKTEDVVQTNKERDIETYIHTLICKSTK